MTTLRRWLPSCVLVIVGASLVACSGDPNPVNTAMPEQGAPRNAGKKGPDSKQTAEVSKDAVVFTQAESNDVALTVDALEIPVAGHEHIIQRLARGVTLVGQPSGTHPGKNKNGFLRRVVTFKYSDDKSLVRVTTTPGSLKDIFTKGDVVMNFTDPMNGRAANTETGAGMKTNSLRPLDGPTNIATFGGNIDQELKVTLDIDESNVSGEATATLKGSATVTPQVWASATYANDANRTTDLETCFQPRPACAQQEQFTAQAFCAGKSMGMWCAEGSTTARIFCSGNGDLGCVEECAGRYGAGSSCQVMPPGTDDQCAEMPDTVVPRVCLDRGDLTRLELGASIDLNLDVDWTVAVTAQINGGPMVHDHFSNTTIAEEDLALPVSANFVIPGPVPIPVEVRGRLIAKCEASMFGTLTASGKTVVHAQPGFGISYEGGNFSPLPLDAATIETQNLQVVAAAGVELKCSPFVPRLTLFLFDSDIVGIGPYVQAGYYRKVRAAIQSDQACAVQLTESHGVDARIGGEFRVFGADVTPEWLAEGKSFETNWDPLRQACIANPFATNP